MNTEELIVLHDASHIVALLYLGERAHADHFDALAQQRELRVGPVAAYLPPKTVLSVQQTEYKLVLVRSAPVRVCFPDVKRLGGDHCNCFRPPGARGHYLYDLVAVHVALVRVDDHGPEVLEVERAPNAV
jgi:hypothetical protein